MKNRVDEVTESFALGGCMELFCVIVRFINADEDITEENIFLWILKILKSNDICGTFMPQVFFIHSGHAFGIYEIPAEFRFFYTHLRKQQQNGWATERDIETKPRVKIAKG